MRKIMFFPLLFLACIPVFSISITGELNTKNIEVINWGFSSNAVTDWSHTPLSIEDPLKLEVGELDFTAENEAIQTASSPKEGLYVYWKLFTDQPFKLYIMGSGDLIGKENSDAISWSLKEGVNEWLNSGNAYGKNDDSGLGVLLRSFTNAGDSFQFFYGSIELDLATENLIGHRDDTYTTSLTLSFVYG